MAELTMMRTNKKKESGLTMLEIIVTLLILSTCALPLVIALADAQRQVVRSSKKRVLKQLLEYKLAHVLLDRPAEEDDPIYVDGAEGNFGDDFAGDPDKEFWFDDDMYFYSYRIDSEELDLGSGGGETGEEDEFREDEVVGDSDDAGGSPFGDEEATEEDLSQMRFRVTLTVFYQPGNANFNQSLSVVTYVKHPHQKENMSGPESGGAGGGLPGFGNPGGGEANVGTTTATADGVFRSISNGGGR